ncbi:MAG: hypothetical protein ABJC88_16865 [Parasphingorhabdus sp.]|uniref:hypothetical protein n=1 Tax=Sphingomonadales TaxID=204457 RepID=UPI0032662360
MVSDWIKDFTESTIGGAPFAIGDIVRHPEHGKVEITGGQYWGAHGLSNFWDYTALDTGEKHNGYGWVIDQ